MELRKLERSDLEWLLEIKRTCRTHHHVSILNMEDQHAWYDSLHDHPCSPRELVMVGVKEGRLIGAFKIKVDWVNRIATVGWDIHPDYVGRGLCGDLVRSGVNFCFHTLNLRRTECEILSNNEASLRCAETVGFLREGVRRHAILRDGISLSSVLYGLVYSGDRT